MCVAHYYIYMYIYVCVLHMTMCAAAEARLNTVMRPRVDNDVMSGVASSERVCVCRHRSLSKPLPAQDMAEDEQELRKVFAGTVPVASTWQRGPAGGAAPEPLFACDATMWSTFKCVKCAPRHAAL